MGAACLFFQFFLIQKADSRTSSCNSCYINLFTCLQLGVQGNKLLHQFHKLRDISGNPFRTALDVIEPGVQFP